MAYDEHNQRPELVQKRARMIAVERFSVVLVALMLTVILLLDIFNTYVETQKRNRLMDCTTPGGQCFAESQRRTAQAIKQIIDENVFEEVATRRVVVLAAQCANRAGVQTVDQIESCVEYGLGER